MLELCKERFLHVVHKDFKDVEVASRLHADRGYEMKDAVILAAALRSSCKVLLSEDMQDGAIVQDRKGYGGGQTLRIVNPFFDKAN